MTDPKRKPTVTLGPRYAQAVAYASKLHATQTRKNTTIPYVSHLLGVPSLVLEAGGGEDLAIAALLHDGSDDQGGQATLGCFLFLSEAFTSSFEMSKTKWFATL